MKNGIDDDLVCLSRFLEGNFMSIEPSSCLIILAGFIEIRSCWDRLCLRSLIYAKQVFKKDVKNLTS